MVAVFQFGFELFEFELDLSEIEPKRCRAGRNINKAGKFTEVGMLDLATLIPENILLNKATIQLI